MIRSPKEGPQHLRHVAHDPIEIQQARLQDLLPAEGEELAGQARGALRGLLDQGEAGGHRVGGSRALPQQAGAAQDDRQQVVEVVGDAARQEPHRLHLLSLEQLLGALSDLRLQVLGVSAERFFLDLLAIDHGEQRVEPEVQHEAPGHGDGPDDEAGPEDRREEALRRLVHLDDADDLPPRARADRHVDLGQGAELATLVAVLGLGGRLDLHLQLAGEGPQELVVVGKPPTDQVGLVRPQDGGVRTPDLDPHDFREALEHPGEVAPPLAGSLRRRLREHLFQAVDLNFPTNERGRVLPLPCRDGPAQEGGDGEAHGQGESRDREEAQQSEP